ncbi:MAG TPA: MFS transporter [Candidatus Tectomicrobia bacterium]|nr:MFS transporter [Candidatus Tectomicrobia bacterium]
MKANDEPEAPHERSRRWLNRTVGGAGLTSALGDFSYETTTVILPAFLAVLGIPAAVLGLIEGIADAVSSFTKMGAGYIADKLGRRKALVVLGYALTPVGQAFIALAVGWPLLLLGLLVSWFGKGLRGPLRDAIVTQAISPDTLGMSYGALGTVNGTAKFISSTAVGLLWTLVSPVVSFGLAALFMAAGTGALVRVRGHGHPRHTR